MVTRAASRPAELRRHNLSLLLTQIHTHGVLSRVELGQMSGLNRSTVGGLVSELCLLGLVSENVPMGSERVGRPSHLVGPRPDGPYAVAVEVDADHVISAAVRLGGEVAARIDHNLAASAIDPDTVADLIARDLAPLAAAMPPGAWPIGVGVSIPGTVRRTDGTIDQAPNLNWRDEPFASRLAVRLEDQLPVHLGNDADLGALAEQLRGAARSSGNLLYLSGKIGVGGGLVVDGRQLAGSGGFAGEIGHMVLDPAGPPCHCGSAGCLESFVGDAALLRFAGRTGTPGRASLATLMADARDGDQPALDGIRTAARWLGLGIANVVNLLNPEIVIAGGSFADILELARPEIEQELDRHAMTAARSMVELRVPDLGSDSSLLGAAELSFQALLQDPVAASSARQVAG
ncbi:MAG: family transcriptional regulator [Frankiales bacterium]|nr:family transcriptional regulator [Frankiales bacterium]